MCEREREGEEREREREGGGGGGDVDGIVYITTIGQCWGDISLLPYFHSF